MENNFKIDSGLQTGTITISASNFPDVEYVNGSDNDPNDDFDTEDPNEYDEDESLDSKAKDPKKELNKSDQKEPTHSYTFSNNSFAVFMVVSYVLHKFIKNIADDYTVKDIEAKRSIEIDYDKKTEVEIMCRYTFCIENKIYELRTHSKTFNNYLTSEHDLNPLISMLEHEIKYNNPLIRKHLYLYNTNDGLMWTIKKPPTTKFESVKINERIKEQIIDNTIFHLKYMDSNNGIILHGPPGTGKSFVCQAVIAGCLEEKFSTCFITTAVNFSALDDLIKTLLGTTLIVLEDIDSYATTREIQNNPSLAAFLQFMSGLTERDDRIVVVATTNHIDKLDEAVGNRPMRFNAKFKFDYPNEEEIFWLIDHYFGPDQITKDKKLKCCNKKFTGSHIRAMRDRRVQIEKKNEIKHLTVENSFDEAFDFILEQFPPDKKDSPGFKFNN